MFDNQSFPLYACVLWGAGIKLILLRARGLAGTLFQQMSEEAVRFFVIHSAALRIILECLHAYPPYLRVTCLLVHEYHSADAGFRDHRVTLCQFYSQSVFVTVTA